MHIHMYAHAQVHNMHTYDQDGNKLEHGFGVGYGDQIEARRYGLCSAVCRVGVRPVSKGGVLGTVCSGVCMVCVCVCVCGACSGFM